MEKFLICADSHGDEIDLRTRDALLDRKRDMKPDYLCHLGDLWNFAAIRRNASKEDRAVSLIDDCDAGIEFAKEFFKGKAKKYFCYGNHDWRIFEMCDDLDAVRSGIAQDITQKMRVMFKGLDVKTVDFDAGEWHDIGRIRMMHGFKHNMHAAKGHAEHYGGMANLVLCGDLHAKLYWRSASADPVECYHIPCMTDLRPNYARRFINKLKHRQGWAEVYSDGDEHIVQIIERRGDKFHAFKEIKIY